MSRSLEEWLGVSPAAKPGLPPEEPTRGRRLFDWFFGLSDSVHFLMILGCLFLASLLFPAQASKFFLAVAYFYHLLSEAWKAML